MNPAVIPGNAFGLGPSPKAKSNKMFVHTLEGYNVIEMLHIAPTKEVCRVTLATDTFLFGDEAPSAKATRSLYRRPAQRICQIRMYGPNPQTGGPTARVSTVIQHIDQALRAENNGQGIQFLSLEETYAHLETLDKLQHILDSYFFRGPPGPNDVPIAGPSYRLIHSLDMLTHKYEDAFSLRSSIVCLKVLVDTTGTCSAFSGEGEPPRSVDAVEISAQEKEQSDRLRSLLSESCYIRTPTVQGSPSKELRSQDGATQNNNGENPPSAPAAATS